MIAVAVGVVVAAAAAACCDTRADVKCCHGTCRHWDGDGDGGGGDDDGVFA